MTIEALALLQGSDLGLSEQTNLRIRPLEDGVLVHTGAPFASEPAALSQHLQDLLGAALERHLDARGIFFVPSVAPVAARRYDAVLAEVGEAGMWGPRPHATTPAQPEDALGAMLGGMLAQLPSGLLEAATKAATSGDLRALETAGAQLESLLGGSAGLEAMAAQVKKSLPDAAQAEAALPGLQQMLASFGLDTSSMDLSSPELQQLIVQLQGQLAADPALLNELTARLFGKK